MKSANSRERELSDSLTNCIVLAVTDHYGTKDIFGFDEQGADAGYERLAPMTAWKKAA